MFFLYLVTLSARDNQKPSKLLSKGFERSVSWNEYKAKSENKNMTNEFRYSLESNFAGETYISPPFPFSWEKSQAPFYKEENFENSTPLL